MTPAIRLHLARAHATMALVVLALAAAAMLFPSGTSSAAKPMLEAAAYLLRGAALAYLLLTAVALWRQQTALREWDRPPPQLNLLAWLGHLWVLWVAGAAALRGTDSRALLAGCDPTLAALVAASVLCLILLTIDWWLLRGGGRRQARETSTAVRRAWPEWLSGLAAWLVVLALWYLESRPLP